MKLGAIVILGEGTVRCCAPNEMALLFWAEGEMQMESANVDELLCGGDVMQMDRALERLTATAEMLERAVEKMTEREGSFAVQAEASIGRIVATVEGRREVELEQKLAAAETELSQLRAKAAGSGEAERGRKTVPAAMGSLLAKQGVVVESLEAGALDAALVSLSLEQRIAVKAQLMRAGLLG